MGDFYTELGVQAIQVCMQEQARTGGLLLLPELLTSLRALRGPRASDISE